MRVKAFLRAASVLIFALSVGLRPGLSQQSGTQPEEPSLAELLPHIDPVEPADALATFEIAAGFELQLVAAEPDVVDPVDMAFDEDGRMYVVEMRDYPFGHDLPELPIGARTPAPPGRVRLLEDTDGDGRVDRSTVFADDLSWPTAIVLFDGGAFVAVPPEIIYLKDSDGDRVADVRETVFTGFGTQNVQALLNNLRWGLDNWVYGSSGGNGGEISPPYEGGAAGGSGGQQPTTLAVIRGQDFRFRPAGFPRLSAARQEPRPSGSHAPAFEAISGGGQFGHTIDDWGRRFVCNNSNHARHVVLEARYLDRNPYLAAPGVIADIAAEGAAAPVFRLSPAEPWRLVRTARRASGPDAGNYAPTELVPIGFFTSATGITVYRGSAYGDEFGGNLFIGDVGGNLVHRKVLEPAGATFVARRGEEGTEFLRSSDNWFRPVNFCNGPDGCLYVLDMYRHTIEHPDSIPDDIKRHLDLHEGNDRGRIWRIVPEGFVIPPAPRLSRATTDELVAALERPDAWWRETAQRLLLERNDRGAVAPLRRLAAQSPLPQARVHALWTLEGLGALDAESVIRALGDEHPRVREQAIRLAEVLLGAGARTAAGQDVRLLEEAGFLADDPDAAVRFQLALTLGEVEDATAIEALARIARQDAADRWTGPAILSSVPARAGALVEELLADPEFAGRPGADGFAELAASIVGTRAEPAEVASLVIRLAPPSSQRSTAPPLSTTERGVGGEGRHPLLRFAVLAGLGEGLRRGGHDLSSVLAESADADRATEIADQLFARAAVVCADGASDAALRVRAVEAMALAPFPRAAEALAPLLSAQQPPPVQLAAIRALSDFDEAEVAGLLLGAWRSYTPTVRREVVEALLRRRDRTRALLEAVRDETVRASDIDPARREALLASDDAEVRALAAEVLPSVSSNRQEVIARYRSALESEGDVQRGRTLFREHCATCHRQEDVGTDVGPDLATVRDRAADALLVEILDPNRDVQPRYLNYTVATLDGEVLTGIIVSETAASIALRRAEGAEDVVLRSQIEEMVSSDTSLMPEGFEEKLSPQDVADLIAYLLRSDA